MNTADIFVLAVIALMAIIGLYRGFILTLFGLLGYVLAALAAKWYYPVASAYIRANTGFFESIRTGVLGRLEAYVAAHPEVLQAGGASDNMSLTGFPKTIEEMLLGKEVLSGFGSRISLEILADLAESFAKLAIDAISILLIFIAAKMVVSLIAHLLDKVFSMPVIRTFNKGGGFVLGLAKGVFVVYLLAILMIPVASAFPEHYIVAQLETSKYAVQFFDNNLLMQLVYTFVSNGS